VREAKLSHTEKDVGLWCNNGFQQASVGLKLSFRDFWNEKRHKFSALSNELIIICSLLQENGNYLGWESSLQPKAMLREEFNYPTLDGNSSWNWEHESLGNIVMWRDVGSNNFVPFGKNFPMVLVGLLSWGNMQKIKLVGKSRVLITAYGIREENYTHYLHYYLLRFLSSMVSIQFFILTLVYMFGEQDPYYWGCQDFENHVLLRLQMWNECICNQNWAEKWSSNALMDHLLCVCPPPEDQGPLFLKLINFFPKDLLETEVSDSTNSL
jgi:hypothetical protein